MLACLALQLVAVAHAVVHLPDIDPLVSARGAWGWLYRRAARRLIAATAGRPSAFLLVESPDDLTALRARGVDPGARFAVLGGCGVDPDTYPVLPPSSGEMPVAAFVGEMTASSGVEVLMRAFDRVWARGVRLRLELVGGSARREAATPSPPISSRSGACVPACICWARRRTCARCGGAPRFACCRHSAGRAPRARCSRPPPAGAR